MRRKIYDQLLQWKNESKGECAVLIDGARRVGKSYIAEEFAKKEYKSYLIIDFQKVSPEVKRLFNDYLDDLDTLFLYLSEYYSTKLERRKSLIIFDEVQEFPRARAAIKYLVADGRFDYMETGSLMSIKKNVEGIVVPSEEMHLKMYPMDFEEFLWAMGNDTLMPIINKRFTERKPMGQLLHRKAMDYFRLYMILGGMPQVILKYLSTKDFEKTDIVKRNIIEMYKTDIAKHAKGYEEKTRSAFDNIPAQLNRHEKKYKISSLTKNARFRDYQDSFFWLKESMIANICYNSTEPNIGLRMNEDRTTLKCYLGDTGLLISMAFDESGIVSEQIYRKILFDKLEVNKGMLIENIVAQMLVASKHNLFFFSKYDKKKAENTMEIDFLLAKSKVTSRHNICPIEVKSSKNYTLSSIRKFIEKYNENVGTAFVIHVQDLKEEGNTVYLPIYMTPCL